MQTAERVQQHLVPAFPTRGWRTWVGPGAVTVLGGVLRFANLGQPNAVVFDETYYAMDGWGLLRFGVEVKEVEGHKDLMLSAGDNWRTVEAFTNEGAFVVHPPVGKWVIAAGEYMFGVTPFGWRFMVALLGTVSVLLIARIVRRLTRNDVLGVIAGFLLAIEGMHLVMSRTALLDGVVTFFVLCAFGFLLIDRDTTRMKVASLLDSQGLSAISQGTGPAFGPRWWRWAAAFTLALAVATKWSGLWFLAIFMLMSVLWDVSTRRTIGVRHPWRATFIRDLPGAVLSSALILIAVYLMSWLGWFRSDIGWGRNWAADQDPSPVPNALRSFANYHREAWNFHVNLDSEHNYSSNPLSWPFMTRPTSFHYSGDEVGCGADKCVSEVLALANPIIWWAALLAVPYQLWRWIAQRDWRSGAVLAGIAAGWLPWLLYLDRTIFTFYTVVYTPFVVMAVTLTVGAILARRTKARLAIVGAFLVLALIAAWWFYPIWTGEVIPYDAWRLRMWMPTWV